jgi:hypothetical protein
MLTGQHRKSVGRLLRRKPIKNLTLSSDGEAAKLRPEKSRQANRAEKGFAPMRS